VNWIRRYSLFASAPQPEPEPLPEPFVAAPGSWTTCRDTSCPVTAPVTASVPVSNKPPAGHLNPSYPQSLFKE